MFDLVLMLLLTSVPHCITVRYLLYVSGKYISSGIDILICRYSVFRVYTHSKMGCVFNSFSYIISFRIINFVTLALAPNLDMFANCIMHFTFPNSSSGGHALAPFLLFLALRNVRPDYNKNNPIDILNMSIIDPSCSQRKISSTLLAETLYQFRMLLLHQRV